HLGSCHSMLATSVDLTPMSSFILFASSIVLLSSPTRRSSDLKYSITLDDPQAEETPTLPCLATEYPAPATTKDARVEILNVFFPSPPVPQRSTKSKSSKSSFKQRSNIASLNPASSSTLMLRIP